MMSSESDLLLNDQNRSKTEAKVKIHMKKGCVPQSSKIPQHHLRPKPCGQYDCNDCHVIPPNSIHWPRSFFPICLWRYLINNSKQEKKTQKRHEMIANIHTKCDTFVSNEWDIWLIDNVLDDSLL